MRAISNRKHEALITALQRLYVLKHGFELQQEMDEQVRTLCKTYQRYQRLLAELAVCIREYEELHHHLKIHVLAPALRQAKKEAEPEAPEYRLALEYIEVARAV